jgi:hypothetical protein
VWKDVTVKVMKLRMVKAVNLRKIDLMYNTTV